MEARAGEARFGRALSSFKGLSGAGYPIPIRAPTGCYPRLVVLTRNARTLVPGAKRRRRRNVETYRKTAVSRSLVRQRWLPLALSGVPIRQPRGASSRTLGGSRTRSNLALNQARLPICGTSAWSRHPVPTRVTRRTKAGTQPCAAAKLAILASNQETPGSGPGGSAKFP